MPLQIEIGQSPDVVGHQVDVKVRAEGDDPIAHVVVKLDGWALAREAFTPPVMLYERRFSQVGSYTPGRTHKITVTVTPRGKPSRTAVRQWKDS